MHNAINMYMFALAEHPHENTATPLALRRTIRTGIRAQQRVSSWPHFLPGLFIDCYPLPGHFLPAEVRLKLSSSCLSFSEDVSAFRIRYTTSS